MPYKLPKLPYDFNSLEPYIDTRTMTVHYRVHHSGFVDELNKVLEGYEDLQKKKVYELLHDLDSVPEEIRPAVRYNGGGHANHSIWWPSLSPSGGGEPDGHIAELTRHGLWLIRTIQTSVQPDGSNLGRQRLDLAVCGCR